MSSHPHTYWARDPVVLSRSVQLPELRQAVVPVNPGRQMHSVVVPGKVVVGGGRRGRQIPPLTHSEEPEQRSVGAFRSASAVQL